MTFDWQAVTDSLFRWTHVVAGIVWIGMLYFFNFVNGPFAGKLDAETKKKVVPELMPRALFWFRWGAAFTWVTGVVLLTLVFYHGKLLVDAQTAETTGHFHTMSILGIAIVFVAPFVYDLLAKSVMKDPKGAFVEGLIFASAYVLFLAYVAKFDTRAYMIHLGAMFGTIMAYNVWFRIWPAQKKIITAVKEGQPPDQALVAMAGGRSKHNTYMSVPLVFAMLDFHNFWISGKPWLMPIIILVGWLVVFMMYKKAAKVQGF